MNRERRADSPADSRERLDNNDAMSSPPRKDRRCLQTARRGRRFTRNESRSERERRTSPKRDRFNPEHAPIRRERFESSSGERAPIKRERYDSGERAPIRRERFGSGDRASIRRERFDPGERDSIRRERFDQGERSSIRRERFDQEGRTPIKRERFDQGEHTPIQITSFGGYRQAKFKHPAPGSRPNFARRGGGGGSIRQGFLRTGFQRERSSDQPPLSGRPNFARRGGGGRGGGWHKSFVRTDVYRVPSPDKPPSRPSVIVRAGAQKRSQALKPKDSPEKMKETAVTRKESEPYIERDPRLRPRNYEPYFDIPARVPKVPSAKTLPSIVEDSKMKTSPIEPKIPEVEQFQIKGEPEEPESEAEAVEDMGTIFAIYLSLDTRQQEILQKSLSQVYLDLSVDGRRKKKKTKAKQTGENIVSSTTTAPTSHGLLNYKEEVKLIGADLSSETESDTDSPAWQENRNENAFKNLSVEDFAVIVASDKKLSSTFYSKLEALQKASMNSYITEKQVESQKIEMKPFPMYGFNTNDTMDYYRPRPVASGKPATVTRAEDLDEPMSVFYKDLLEQPNSSQSTENLKTTSLLPQGYIGPQAMSSLPSYSGGQANLNPLFVSPPDAHMSPIPKDCNQQPSDQESSDEEDDDEIDEEEDSEDEEEFDRAAIEMRYRQVFAKGQGETEAQGEATSPKTIRTIRNPMYTPRTPDYKARSSESSTIDEGKVEELDTTKNLDFNMNKSMETGSWEGYKTRLEHGINPQRPNVIVSPAPINQEHSQRENGNKESRQASKDYTVTLPKLSSKRKLFDDLEEGTKTPMAKPPPTYESTYGSVMQADWDRQRQGVIGYGQTANVWQGWKENELPIAWAPQQNEVPINPLEYDYSQQELSTILDPRIRKREAMRREKIQRAQAAAIMDINIKRLIEIEEEKYASRNMAEINPNLTYIKTVDDFGGMQVDLSQLPTPQEMENIDKTRRFPSPDITPPKVYPPTYSKVFTPRRTSRVRPMSPISMTPRQNLKGAEEIVKTWDTPVKANRRSADSTPIKTHFPVFPRVKIPEIDLSTKIRPISSLPHDELMEKHGALVELMGLDWIKSIDDVDDEELRRKEDLILSRKPQEQLVPHDGLRMCRLHEKRVHKRLTLYFQCVELLGSHMTVYRMMDEEQRIRNKRGDNRPIDNIEVFTIILDKIRDNPGPFKMYLGPMWY